MEKLIRALRCAATTEIDFICPQDCPYRLGVDRWQSCDITRMVLEAAEALEKLEKFQWVPVSERTPDDYGAVLLQYSCRYGFETEQRETLGVGYFDAFGNAEHRTEDCEKFRGEVMAWMPLPEPYKGVENDIRPEEKIRK